MLMHLGEAVGTTRPVFLSVAVRGWIIAAKEVIVLTWSIHLILHGIYKKVP